MSARLPCPNCGYMNTPERKWCKNCSVNLEEARAAEAVSDTPISEDERTKILVEKIQLYTSQGYQVVSQTSNTAQLKRPKEFNVAIAILGLLFFVVGLLLYIIIYLAQSEKSIYIAVDKYGKVNIT